MEKLLTPVVTYAKEQVQNPAPSNVPPPHQRPGSSSGWPFVWSSEWDTFISLQSLSLSFCSIPRRWMKQTFLRYKKCLCCKCGVRTHTHALSLSFLYKTTLQRYSRFYGKWLIDWVCLNWEKTLTSVYVVHLVCVCARRHRLLVVFKRVCVCVESYEWTYE